jgi:hypothetical protein
MAPFGVCAAGDFEARIFSRERVDRKSGERRHGSQKKQLMTELHIDASFL